MQKVAMSAIIAIAIILITAILKGLDGNLITSGLLLLAGLGGYSSAQLMKK